MDALPIRQAIASDLAQITEIWRAGASAAGLSLDAADVNIESFFEQLIARQDSRFQIWLVEDSRKRILGWQALSACRNNPVSKLQTAESSTYVRREDVCRGLGRRLLLHAMEHAARVGIHNIVGYICPDNGAIIHLVSTLGWKLSGRIPKAHPHEAEDELLIYIYSSRTKADPN